MSIQRPTAALALGGGGGALSLAQAAVWRLGADLSVDEGHDRVQLWLGAGSPLIDAQPRDRLRVGIGDGDDVTDVLTVEVAGVDTTVWGAVLTGFAPSRRLSASYLGRCYVDQSVAAIVEDLLATAGVAAGDVDADLQLPVLHVDPRRSVWGHLHALAGRTGHQVTSTAGGAVSFTPIPGAVDGMPGPAPSAQLRQGAELITFLAGPRPAVAAAAVFTPSAGNAEKWHLLAAEPDSGSGDPVLVDPMLRTRAAADAATSAYRAAATRRTRRATLTVPGRPQLRAGATVTAIEALYRVLRVRHLLDADTGYRSDLLLEADR